MYIALHFYEQGLAIRVIIVIDNGFDLFVPLLAGAGQDGGGRVWRAGGIQHPEMLVPDSDGSTALCGGGDPPRTAGIAHAGHGVRLYCGAGKGRGRL